MSVNERSIQAAKDRISSRIFYAEDVFRTQAEGFAFRNEYNSGEIDLECPECQQNLSVPNSKNDNLYFRHFPNSDYCILKEEVDKEILDGYYKSLYSRESDRHKELKNRIGKGLIHVEGVALSSIDIDKKFIVRGKDKRRPDVYCVLNNREVVFEIQLSSLPPKYVIHRHRFYQKHGIFLIWILDTKDPLLLTNMQRDIKYLNSYQNIFSLDEASDNLKFRCSYKYPFIYQEEEVHEKWNTKSVNLEEFKFSSETIEPYYFNYTQEKSRCESQLQSLVFAAKQKELEKQRQVRVEQHKNSIQLAIAEIRKYRKWDYNFYSMYNLFKDWHSDQVNLLNVELGLNGKIVNGEPVLNHYIKVYKSNQQGSRTSFIEFLICELKIMLDINAKDENGTGCLQCVYENPFIEDRLFKIVPAIFMRGYHMTEHDRHYFRVTQISSVDDLTMLKLNYYDSLSDRSMAPLVTKHFTYLLFIESALQKRIIGSGLKSWVQYIVACQGRNKEFWNYSMLALLKKGIWQMALNDDKKGTLNRKIIEFKLESYAPDQEMGILLNDLYPELFS